MAVASNQYRCPIIGMAPNWSTPVVTTFCWKTAIAESLDGHEKRIPCRARPLIKTRFKVTNVDERRSSYIRKLMESRGENAVGVPVWMDSCHTLSAAETIGTTVIIRVNARSRLFPWFKFALLWSDDLNYEVVEIESIEKSGTRNGVEIDTDYVVLSSSPGQVHEADSILVPLAFGKLKIPDSRFYTNAVSEIEIDFEEKLGWIGTEKTTDLGGPGTYEAGAVITGTSFLLEPNWEGKPIQGLMDDIDFEPLDRGRTLPRTMSTSKRRTFGFSYLVTRYELQRVLRFFEIHDGRRGAFYVPTWTHDYTVTQNVAASAVAIPLQRTGLASMPASYSALYNLDGDTPVLMRGSTVRDDCHEVFLPTPPDHGVIGAGTPLSGAAKVRLEDDEIEITSASPNAHKFELTFIELTHEGESAGYQEGGGVIPYYEDSYQQKIGMPGHRETCVYKIHRGSESRYFIDWPTQSFLANSEGARMMVRDGIGNETPLVAQAADIHHNGVELTEDSLAKEVEIEVAGDAADYLLEDMESPVDVTIYSAKFQTTLETVEGHLRTSELRARCTLFYEGRIESFDISDRILHATLSSTLRVLDKDAPNIIVQRKCNHIFCSTNCGINKQSTIRRGTCDITVPMLLSGNFTVENVVFSADQDNADSFWAGAKIIIAYRKDESDDASCPEYYSGIVTRVYRNDGGGLCFDFCGECDARYALGDEEVPERISDVTIFTLYPVCCRTIGSCATFNNEVKFCGFPWLPNNNPLSSLKIDYDARGKK